MIDVLVDTAVADSYQPPAGIDAAVHAACSVSDCGDFDAEICIRFASDDAVWQLNHEWRGKDRVTDVLSFPMQDDAEIDPAMPLGDVALAVPFIEKEAERLGIAAEAHALHLVIHATLHLLGYDHVEDDEAMAMQKLERQAMQKLGLHDPYPDAES